MKTTGVKFPPKRKPEQDLDLAVVRRSAGTAVSAHADLTGLEADDHPQYPLQVEAETFAMFVSF
jgi:hypothetical protein